jgi:hypothetical protein
MALQEDDVDCSPAAMVYFKNRFSIGRYLQAGSIVRKLLEKITRGAA